MKRLLVCVDGSAYSQVCSRYAAWFAQRAGYAVEGAGNLTSPWSTSGMPSATFANGTNVLLLPMTNGVEFFRLVEPNF